MNDEAARQGRPDTNSITCADDSNGRGQQQVRLAEEQGMGMSFWTAADAAELDVLVYELVRRTAEHRENCSACRDDCADYDAWQAHLECCPACRGDAPLTYGPPCSRHAEFVAHGDGCLRCNRCATVTAMVGIVVDWRAGRILRSKAAWLRHREAG